MVEASAAMKFIQNQKNLSTLGGKENRLLKDNKLTLLALLMRRTKTKEALLGNRGTINLKQLT